MCAVIARPDVIKPVCILHVYCILKYGVVGILSTSVFLSSRFSPPLNISRAAITVWRIRAIIRNTFFRQLITEITTDGENNTQVVREMFNGGEGRLEKMTLVDNIPSTPCQQLVMWHNITLISKTSELTDRDLIIRMFTKTYTDIQKHWN